MGEIPTIIDPRMRMPTVRDAAYTALNLAVQHNQVLNSAGHLFDRLIPAVAALQAAAGIPPEQRVDYRPPSQNLVEFADGSKKWQPLDEPVPDGASVIHTGPKPATQKTGMQFIESEERIAGFGGPKP